MMGYSNDDAFSRAVMQVTGEKSRGRRLTDLLFARHFRFGVAQAEANWRAAPPPSVNSSAADGGGRRTDSKALKD